MEIRHKLTLQFTIVVAFLLLAILATNFYQAYVFARESFINRLKERAISVASMNLDQDDEHVTQFDELNKKYKQFLIGETIKIYDSSKKTVYYEQVDSFQIQDDQVAGVGGKDFEISFSNARYLIGFPYQINDKDYFIVASAVDEVGRSKLINQFEAMLASFLTFLVFVVLAGQYLSKKALEPIKTVISQVNAISAESLDKRVKYNNNTDEIAQLASTFNSMLDRLEDSFKSQSSFVRNASHELRNPLAAMIGQAEITLNKDRDNVYYKEVLNTLFQEALRLKHIVNSLLELSQASSEVMEANIEKIRLDELLLDIVENLAKSKKYNQIEISLLDNYDQEPIYLGNRKLLEVAIRNLVENACKYSNGKRVFCCLEQFQDKIILRVEDEGIGMTAEEIKFFTEPFFRSSKARSKEGFGIGMAIANKILQIHGISMVVLSQPDNGTTISLTFEKA